MVKIVFTLLYVAMGMLGELLVACVFIAFDWNTDIKQIGYFATYIMLLFLIKSMKYFLKGKVINSVTWSTNLKILLLPIGSIFLAYRIFYTQYELGIRGFYWKTMLSIIILLSINIMMFNIFVKLSENLALKRKAAIYEKEFDLLEQHMHEREKLLQDFRVKRHDLKHQMLNLLELLNKGDYEKMETRIEQLAELKSLDGLFLVQTDNSFVDTFVNSKYAVACAHGIHFTANLQIPSELPFKGEDLCVILGNALDNAIEACLRGSVKNRNIDLQMMYDGENLIIMIENSFDGKLEKSMKGGWLTRKENAQQHGIGIYSIQNTIKKYNGYYHVDVKEKKYCLEMILYKK